MGRFIRVTCPNCGHSFYVEVKRERAKGLGAHYARQIERLTPLHMAILKLLAREGPLSKEEIRRLLEAQGIKKSGNSISGRLSELAGLRLVEVRNTRVREIDPSTKEFRFVSKPIWFITDVGRYVAEHGIYDVRHLTWL